MKHLIIYAHPNAGSLNHLIKQTVVNILKKENHEVVIRDLYELNFNPVLSLEDMAGQRRGQVDTLIGEEQKHIEWAETITFIYPIWWTGMPAIMKGYIDRVMSYGFAYRYDQGIQKGLLVGKQAFVINTHGKSHAEYSAIGMDTALRLTSDKGIYTYCGLDLKHHLFFDKADRATKEIVDRWVAEIEEMYLQPVTVC
ncbi:NAD(P)H-dependent oxidoreductase [Runella sp.]|uniref:NAD(P)H-dependent oxidoreductase n=1 Tax=Runella sp. TaxID=1960881 RepID=UPI003D11A5F7